eukprot:361474-Chlamydomonas_euryale.AAC.1
MRQLAVARGSEAEAAAAREAEAHAAAAAAGAAERESAAAARAAKWELDALRRLKDEQESVGRRGACAGAAPRCFVPAVGALVVWHVHQHEVHGGGGSVGYMACAPP